MSSSPILDSRGEREPACIDLRERFPQYRLAWDESDESGHRDPWSMELVGRYGIVFPHGAEVLGGILFDHPRRRGRLLALAEVASPYAPGKHWQRGDEISFTFRVADFRPVFQVLGIRRRRQLCLEQRAAATERLLRNRLQALRGPCRGELQQPEVPNACRRGADTGTTREGLA